MGFDETPPLTVTKVTPPPEKKPGIMLENVDELVDKLMNEVKII